MNDLFEPDGFHVGRVMALQPHLQPNDLSEAVMATEDPRVIGYLTNVLRVWSQSRHDLPRTFADELEVTAVHRQPLTVIVAETQHVHRGVSPVDEPYAGGSINTANWSTTDRFQMQPVNPTVFPAAEQHESFALAGRESVSECADCSGAGQSACGRCGGLGNVICENCSGTQQIICPRCGGGGTHIGVSGRYINCQLCRTRGTVRCTSCVKGQVACGNCIGGRITCDRCKGNGRLKRRWELKSRIRTVEHRDVNIREPWPLELSAVHNDMEETARREWEWPLEKPPEKPFGDELPGEIQRAAEGALNAALQQERVVDAEKHRITGLRVRVLGTYVYGVDFVFRERTERAYISGSTNRVFTKREAIRAPGFVTKIKKFGSRLLDKTFVTGGIEIDRGYLTAVREARAHIADPKCVIPAVAQLLKLKATVTGSGYQIDIPLTQPVGDKQYIALLIDLDVDAGNRPIIYAHYAIGPAQRDRFPRVLEINSTLSFGRLAVVEIPGTGRQMFEYVDCRLYELVRTDHLAIVLRGIAVEIAGLYTRRELQ